MSAWNGVARSKDILIMQQFLQAPRCRRRISANCERRGEQAAVVVVSVLAAALLAFVRRDCLSWRTWRGPRARLVAPTRSERQPARARANTCCERRGNTTMRSAMCNVQLCHWVLEQHDDTDALVHVRHLNHHTTRPNSTRCTYRVALNRF